MGQDSTTAITFAQVQKLVKQGPKDSKLVEAMDRLAGVGLLVFGVAVSPGALSLLGAKNEVSRLGQAVAGKLLGRRDWNFLDRARRMAAANYLITFTSFFDALEAELPGFLAQVALSDAERTFLANAALADRFALPLPHPADPLPSVRERRVFHERLGEQFQQFALGLEFADPVAGARALERETGVKQAVRAAESVYQAQLARLMASSPEFCSWTVHRDHERIDLGLRELAGTVAALSPAAQAHRVAEALSAEYADRLEAPVFGDGARDGLRYPSKSEAFVPQAFKVLLCESGTRLEHEPTWEEAPVRADIGEFLLRYLSAPHSTERPLLVLGHPGSGKSLLTEVLAARLAAPAFTVVRVELRDIDPEQDLQDQLELQIKRYTGRTQSWPDFAESRVDSPPLVILDGYDELLQANGKVFADYLSHVHRFQQREARHRRPVRILVTSRVTLIDKAAVPPEVTALRLLEFDAPRREAWAEIWNRHNTRKFAVPDSPALLELAEQPLLLLMLAIYDATVQPLAATTGLDRTQLYHSLITEFVRRERAKNPEDRRAEDLSTLVSADVERLGVAAIGMFNRSAVHILATDLDADLAHFNRSRTIPDSTGRRLSQAELLVGSFFFIHESRGHVDNATAYEFLHNTFGEFLAAHFLLDQVLRETATIRSLGGDASRVRLGQDWFSCLIHAPLHTRPLLLQLLREWARHRFAPADLEALEEIVNHQLHGLLFSTGTFLPVPGSRPVLEHLALYSLNLVLLRAVLSNGRYVLCESQIGAPRCWDQLTHLWRMWFSVETLSALTGVYEASRNGDTITLLLRPEEFAAAGFRDRLHTVFGAADALADRTTLGLAGIPIVEANPARLVRQHVEVSLMQEGIDLSSRFTVLRARQDPTLLSESGWLRGVVRADGQRPAEEVYAALPLLRSTLGPFPGPAVHYLIESVRQVSRSEASAIIDFCAWAFPTAPNWLIEQYGEDTLAREIISGAAYGAPLLNACADNPAPRGCTVLLRRLVILARQEKHRLDAETAVALARFADVGEARELCRWALSNLPSPLATLPLDSIHELARLLVDHKHPELAPVRIAVADRLAAEYDQRSFRSDMPELAQRLAQLARISGPQHSVTERFLNLLVSILSARPQEAHPWRTNRLVLRAARENAGLSSAPVLIRVLASGQENLLKQLGLLPFRRHGTELTVRDIRDLTWLATQLGNETMQTALVKSLRAHGLR